MKSQLKALVVGSLTALVGILSPPTVLATGTGTCYSVNDPAGTAEGSLIIRYRTTNVGPLTSDAEVQKYGHLKQQVYRVVGKGTALEKEVVECSPLQTPPCFDEDRIMTTVDGTIITGKNPGSADGTGAHMGLDVQFLRFDFDDEEDPLFLGPITLECSSFGTSPTPDQWFCNLKAEFQPVFPPPEGPIFIVLGLPLPITLQKVKAIDEEACSVFQDGGGDLPIIPPV